MSKTCDDCGYVILGDLTVSCQRCGASVRPTHADLCIICQRRPTAPDQTDYCVQCMAQGAADASADREPTHADLAAEAAAVEEYGAAVPEYDAEHLGAMADVWRESDDARREREADLVWHRENCADDGPPTEDLTDAARAAYGLALRARVADLFNAHASDEDADEFYNRSVSLDDAANEWRERHLSSAVRDANPPTPRGWASLGDGAETAAAEGAGAALNADTRRRYEEAVKGPGKFEGEPAYVPYFYDQANEGMADEDVGDWFSFAVRPGDVLIFPELAGRGHVYLCERDDGFVSEVDWRPDEDDPPSAETDEVTDGPARDYNATDPNRKCAGCGGAVAFNDDALCAACVF
jgi:hypothetical protein